MLDVQSAADLDHLDHALLDAADNDRLLHKAVILICGHRIVCAVLLPEIVDRNKIHKAAAGVSLIQQGSLCAGIEPEIGGIVQPDVHSVP